MRRIFARLGEDATFTHGTSQGSSVKVIYVAPNAVLPGGLDAGFSSIEPRIAAMTADLPSIAQGDTFTLAALLDGTAQIRGTQNYSIVDIESVDPAGFTVCQVQKTS